MLSRKLLLFPSVHLRQLYARFGSRSTRAKGGVLGGVGGFEGRGFQNVASGKFDDWSKGSKPPSRAVDIFIRNLIGVDKFYSSADWLGK